MGGIFKRMHSGKVMTTAFVVLMVLGGVAYGQLLRDAEMEVEQGKSSVSAMFVLGDSSVDCGENALLYPFLGRNLSLHPCDGSDTTLLPHLLAKKIGLPYPPTFYSQNGTIEGLLGGLNFGSAQATIMNLRPQNHQSLDQQLRQFFETLQLLQLNLGQDYVYQFTESAVFYLSFGKDDYVNLLSRNSSSRPGLRNYGGRRYARVLVNQMTSLIRNLYDANARRVVCAGMLPLGCAPRMVWRWYNFTGRDDDGLGCVEGINQLAVDYNTMLEESIAQLNVELPDARIVFCDVYQGIMEIITNPKGYGFEDARDACCGLGWLGGMVGCVSMDLGCQRPSAHVWWDFYNPTPAVNSLLADSAWSGQPLLDICRPDTVAELVSASAPLFV